MTDRTIKITDVPDGEWREQVLALANGAKSIFYHGGGGTMPPDDLFIRGALAVLSAIRGGEREHPDSAALLVCMTAGQFFQDVDQDPPVRAELLRERLHSPADVIAGMVANNRRLLGLDSGAGEGGEA